MRRKVLLRFSIALLAALQLPAQGSGDPWPAAIARATETSRPIVAYLRPEACESGNRGRSAMACAEFERQLTHPAIALRLDQLVFVTLPARPEAAGAQWNTEKPGIGLFDRRGILRVRWEGLPDAIAFGGLLDATIAVAPDLDRVLVLEDLGRTSEAAIELALCMIGLGRPEAASDALSRAEQSENPDIQQRTAIARSLLRFQEGDFVDAYRILREVVAEPSSPAVGAQAWLTLATLYARAGDSDAAREAALHVLDQSPADSPLHDAAMKTLAGLGGAHPKAISIVPFDRPVSGTTHIRTRIADAAVARVAFTVDGQNLLVVTKPPFTATAEFGRVPERHTISAIAYDHAGRPVDSDSVVVNSTAHAFSVRIVEPSDGETWTGGAFRVDLRSPHDSRHVRHRVWWNETLLFDGVEIPSRLDVPAEPGILRVTSKADGGPEAEDAILLNSPGVVARAEVQLVELPVSVVTPEGQPATLEEQELIVLERGRPGEIESISQGTELPLTVGLIIDSSSSMRMRMMDVQAAAIEFLSTTLEPADRGFIIGFDDRARLLQGVTSDKRLLERAILSIRASGLTALVDAVMLGVLQIEGSTGRRALVVFTDGRDTVSRYTRSDVVEIVRKFGVPVYVIAPGTEAYVPGWLSNEDAKTRLRVLREARNDLASITGAGGGAVFPLDPNDLGSNFTKVANIIRGQQIVVLRVKGAERENEWRPLSFQSRRKDLRVHAPAGYYAP